MCTRIKIRKYLQSFHKKRKIYVIIRLLKRKYYTIKQSLKF